MYWSVLLPGDTNLLKNDNDISNSIALDFVCSNYKDNLVPKNAA